MAKKIIHQGAEAVILLDSKKNIIIKRRVKKEYRIKEIDEKIRKIRTRSEGRILKKASEVVPVPEIVDINETSKEIIMRFIKGKKLSDFLDSFALNKQKNLLKDIGSSVAKLHDLDIIHGDLTTSNMILSDSDSKVYFIDFGLGFRSHRFEDKAVDIYLFKQALEARHFKNWEALFKSFLEGYKASENYERTILQLKKVEKRRRYKH